MNMVLEIVHLTLLSIAKAVYNYWFLMIVWLVYFLIKRIRMHNIYNLENAKSTMNMLIEVILQGIAVGFVGSLIIILLGLPIRLNQSYILFLLPISLALSVINMRYICISYSAAILGILALTINGQQVFGVTLPNIDINVSGLIALVGVLHLMESILIFLVGAQDCAPILCKKEGRIVQGHVLQKYWPIPFVLLFMTSQGASGGGGVQMPDWWPLLKAASNMSGAIIFGIMPLIGVLGYNSVAFAEEPEKRAQKTGGMLFFYSVLMIVLALVTRDSLSFSILGLILMAGIHEMILLLEQRYEKTHEPIYTLPEKGVRIMVIVEGGVADKAGMKRGAIIQKINDQEVLNLKSYHEIMANRFTFLWIETQNLNQQVMTHEIKAYPAGLADLGVKIMPENPRILFKYENLNKVGIMHFIRNRSIKRT